MQTLQIRGSISDKIGLQGTTVTIKYNPGRGPGGTRWNGVVSNDFIQDIDGEPVRTIVVNGVEYNHKTKRPVWRHKWTRGLSISSYSNQRLVESDELRKTREGMFVSEIEFQHRLTMLGAADPVPAKIKR